MEQAPKHVYQGANRGDHIPWNRDSHRGFRSGQEENHNFPVVVHTVKNTLIASALSLLFCFGVIAGSCISYTMERSREDTEAHVMMVNLMSHSLRELGEIRVRGI